MTLDEFYSLSKRECFEKLLDESRSQAKRRLCISLIFMLIFIALIIWIVIYKPQGYEYYTICQFAVFCLGAGWIAVNNFRLLRRLDSLDTPEQLLYWYEKTIKNNHKASFLIILGLIGSFYPDIAYNIKYFNWNWILVELTANVAIIVFLLYIYFKGYQNDRTRRDEEIVDRLEELVKKK